MIPLELLDRTIVPGDENEIRLYRRGEEFSIMVANCELMNSRLHASEDALAELACRRLGQRPRPRVLIGGLGMGFTLAAALHHLGQEAQIVVAELVPAVIKWNKGPLSSLAGHPLQDPRVSIFEGDVGKLIQTESGAYDAILLDVDNGPDGLTRRDNNGLYSHAGLQAASKALRPNGIYAVWSVAADEQFSKRLQRAEFNVEEVRTPARGRKGARHMIWIAEKVRRNKGR